MLTLFFLYLLNVPTQVFWYVYCVSTYEHVFEIFNVHTLLCVYTVGTMICTYTVYNMNLNIISYNIYISHVILAVLHT